MVGRLVSSNLLGELIEENERILDAPPSLIEFLPLGVYACDADGRLRWFNKRAAEVWGREPRLGGAGEFYCGSLRLFGLDGRPIRHEEAPMGEVLRTGKSVEGQRAVVERPDGRGWSPWSISRPSRTPTAMSSARSIAFMT